MRNIRLLTLIIGLVYICIGVYSPLVTLYLEELGANYAHISLILTSVAAVALLSNYLWGHLSDRIGRRKPFLIGGLAMMVVTYGLLSRVTSANLAWPVLVVNGAALAAYMTTSLALVGDLLAGGTRRGRNMGVYRGMASLTFAIGAVAGGRLADATSIGMSFGACTVAFLMASILALNVRESGPVQPSLTDEIPAEGGADDGVHPRRKGTGARQTHGERVPALFLAGVVFWVGGLGAAASMWPNFMAQIGYTKTTISSLWGLAALTEVPAMAIVGNLSDLLGRAPLLASGGLGIGLVLLGYITLSRFLPALIGVQIMRGFAYASYTASAMVFATEWGDEGNRGNNSGLYNAATGGGQLLGTLLGGTIAQTLGFETLFLVCTLLTITSAICFWPLRNRAPAYVEQQAA